MSLRRVTGLDKPARRGPRPRKPIARNSEPIKRHVPVKKRSERRPATASADLTWGNMVRYRADGFCERTSQLGTDAHHVWPKKTHPKLRHEVDNGILLTHEAHENAHKNMKAFRMWFSDSYPDRWARLEALRLAA